MYRFVDDGVSGSDETVVARRTAPRIGADYAFDHLVYPNVHIPDRGLAHTISFTREGSSLRTRLRKEIDAYNAYLDFLESIPGFKAYFINRGLCVTKREIELRWPGQAERIFQRNRYVFSTHLRFIGDCLIDVSISRAYSALVDEVALILPVGKESSCYPSRLGDKRILWNWIDNGHDFCYSIWEMLGEPVRQENECSDDADGVMYYFDFYDQIRECPPEPQLVRIFKKLENLGYIKTVTIKPDCNEPLWRYYGKKDGSLDCAFVDESFFQNKLVMEQIWILLWSTDEVLEEKRFFITDEHDKQILSAVPGVLGGHRKLGIYGKLDCASAKRHLSRGQYAKHRVFFMDEEIAKKAGYRPCAVCMKEEYRRWKAKMKNTGSSDKG